MQKQDAGGQMEDQELIQRILDEVRDVELRNELLRRLAQPSGLGSVLRIQDELSKRGFDAPELGKSTRTRIRIFSVGVYALGAAFVIAGVVGAVRAIAAGEPGGAVFYGFFCLITVLIVWNARRIVNS